jgi:3-methyladenine DNA glycosylase AlkC
MDNHILVKSLSQNKETNNYVKFKVNHKLNQIIKKYCLFVEEIVNLHKKF